MKEIKHNEPAAFKSQKAGGKAQEGVPCDIKLSSDPEADADDVMDEARQYSKNTPSADSGFTCILSGSGYFQGIA